MKYFKVFILLFFLFLISGCAIKNDVNININSDGSLEYKIFLQMDYELLSNVAQANNPEIISNETIDDEFLTNYASTNIKAPYLSGIPFRSIKNGEFYGNEYTYKIDDINKVTSDKVFSVNLADYNNEKELLKDKKLFSKDKNVYSANFIFDLTVSEDEKKYDGIKYYNNISVKLPTKVISHNATSVNKNGKILTWELKHGEINKVEFSFRINNLHMYIGIVACIIDIILLISVIILFMRFRRIKNEK